MKKICISLLIFSLQASLILSCDVEVKAEASKRVSIDDHMAALAALISIPRSSDTHAKRLHKTATGFLASKLIREKNSACKLSYPFLDIEPKPTFCILGLPYQASDLIVSIEEENNKALAQITGTIPFSSFTTHRKSHDDHDEITTTQYESDTSKRILIPRLYAKSKKVHMIINPATENQIIYDISSIAVKEATTNPPTFAQYASDIKITNPTGPMEQVHTHYPNHNIVALASRHPSDFFSDTTKLVTIWIYPKES